MLTLSVPLPIEGYGGNIRCDWQNTIQAFHLYKNLGFKKPIIIGFINAAFYNALLKRTRNDSKLADQIFQREVEACLNTAKNMGISVYFYPVDEAHGKIKEEDQKDHESFALWHYDKSLAFKHLASLIKSVPETKVYLTSIHDFFQKPDIDRLVDVRNYNGQYTKKHNYTWKDWHQIDADVAASGDTMLSYYNTHGNGGRPEYYRVINGLWMLKKTRMVGHLPWTYQMIPQNGEIFDLFREDAPLCFAYPDPDNHFLPTLPSLRWEGFREGVDDIKYIYTLRRAIERAEKEGKPVAEIRLAKRLHQHLMNLITQSGPEAVTLARDFFYEDYQEFRKDFVESIIRLGYAVPPYGEGEK